MRQCKKNDQKYFFDVGRGPSTMIEEVIGLLDGLLLILDCLGAPVGEPRAE